MTTYCSFVERSAERFGYPSLRCPKDPRNGVSCWIGGLEDEGGFERGLDRGWGERRSSRSNGANGAPETRIGSTETV